MKNAQLRDFRYYLLPSGNPSEPNVDLHNRAFLMWTKVWRETFQELHFDSALLHDDFIRQDLIACITYKEKIVALHLFSFFMLDAVAASSFRYFRQNYPEIFQEKLKARNIHHVMSMEYMTVHPLWRKKNVSIHLGAVVASLALQVMLENGVDAAIAPARKDHRVQEFAYILGGECIIPDVMNHNVVCDLIACIKQKVHPHPDPEVRKWVDHLWKSRIVDTGKEKSKLKLVA